MDEQLNREALDVLVVLPDVQSASGEELIEGSGLVVPMQEMHSCGECGYKLRELEVRCQVVLPITP